MKPHTKLDAWKLSMQFVTSIYHITAHFPIEEKFGITSQIRRAAVSIPTNIAEGAARKGYKETIQFYYISLGSLSELETLLLLSVDLKMTDSATLSSATETLEKISKCLYGLIKSLNLRMQFPTANS